jgi:hypothetical protein
MQKNFLIILSAAAGAFFLAHTYQPRQMENFTAVPNFFGQECTTVHCVHPEWAAVGIGCLVAALLVYRKNQV